MALVRPQEGITPFKEKLIRVDTQRIASDLLERYLDPLAQLHLAGMQGDGMWLVKRQPKMKAGVFDNAKRHRTLCHLGPSIEVLDSSK
jgi:hypothetical protein